MEKTFSIRQALAFGFSTFFNHILVLFLAGLTIFAIVVGVVLSFVIVAVVTLWRVGLWQEIKDYNFDIPREALVALLWPTTALASTIASLALVAVMWIFFGLWLGLIRMLLDIYEFDETSVSQLFSCMRMVPKVFGAFMLFGIMTSLGFALLIVPGLVIFALYGFFIFDLLEHDSGIFAAFSHSSRLAKGIVGKLMGFYAIALSMVTVAWIIPLVGLIVTSSIYLARIFVYKKLQEQTK